MEKITAKNHGSADTPEGMGMGTPQGWDNHQINKREIINGDGMTEFVFIEQKHSACDNAVRPLRGYREDRHIFANPGVCKMASPAREHCTRQNPRGYRQCY